ncbi:MAG: hypothetical protein B7Z80_14205 [Rhodospirillales bacterium 20-64-7]|nr:MAG: hypothetical protein B7Z80_14205 [Rhodospirillales bacterium 20-64-7]HQT78265.1 hypothetical protein [Rhodopila sp.]
MLGDIADIAGRLRAVIPKGWFADQAPNLNALLAALATPWTWLYGLISYVITQSRLLSATDSWLDLFALDYFGSGLARRPGEPDFAFRDRIRRTLFQEAATRPALVSGLTDLTGSAPRLFEPARCADTGAYGSLKTALTGSAPPVAYGQAGGWGSLALPYQLFITVTRPATPGISNLSGYGCTFGGYGVGQLGYVDLAELPGSISDGEIEWQVRRLLPVNATAWLRIT